MPPDIDPGTPVYGGLANPVPPEPAPHDPAGNTLEAIYDADTAAGANSYWFDRYRKVLTFTLSTTTP